MGLRSKSEKVLSLFAPSRSEGAIILSSQGDYFIYARKNLS